MATFGATLRGLMADRGLGLRELARKVPCDPGHLSRVSHDQTRPSVKFAEALEWTLEAPGELRPLLPGKRAASRATLEPEAAQETDEDVRRREALQLLAALGVGAGALGSTGESVRQLLALTLDSEPRDLDEWHLTISDHLHALRTRPPERARDGLVVDLLAVQRQLQTADVRQVTELQRVTAALAMLHANILTRLGDHGAAIHWSRTAKAAADASGDLELRLLVRAEEAGLGLYGQRGPEAVLQLVRKAQYIAGGSASVALARFDLAQTQVKALSLLGRHEEAKQRVRRLNISVPDDLRDGPIPAYWTGDQMHFAESWVYAHAGEESRADDARERVLSYGPDYVYGVNVRLHEALCVTVNGGVEQGARQAVEILSELSVSQRVQMITETGKAVLRAVPPGQRERPAVRELRAITGRTALG
ncbi:MULTISPECIES: helix-turn-helix domain-containing protein [Thermomonosporaceae]|uniref:helix-turn-helix domain-containing protein n=1 Tax=Thermomonosporaceae TaxID=2012 RepID=UPI00255AB184|nr:MULTISPECIES: helix-turn-helix transcriptional regulator [Thermomonosporaceae]MDL4773854.1 helix-turn-helix transcriptional regulator [Actinomadura xylanilytica]